MQRRLFVTGGLASAAAMLRARPSLAETIATPIATPLADTGAEEEAVRWFRLASGGFDTMLRGEPGRLVFDVLRFASRAAAHAAVPTLRDNIRLTWRNGSARTYRFDAPEPVSVRRMGDEAHAWSVAITDPGDHDKDAILALVLARTGAIVAIAEAITQSGNPYPLLADQVAAMLRRRPSDKPLRTDDDGMHHGGLWDVLPTLADIPEGYRFDGDTL